VKREAGRIESV